MYCCRVPGLLRGRLHNASILAMKPSSAAASLAPTSCVTLSNWVKWCRAAGAAGHGATVGQLDRLSNVAERNEPVSFTRRRDLT